MRRPVGRPGTVATSFVFVSSIAVACAVTLVSATAALVLMFVLVAAGMVVGGRSRRPAAMMAVAANWTPSWPMVCLPLAMGLTWQNRYAGVALTCAVALAAWTQGQSRARWLPLPASLILLSACMVWFRNVGILSAAESLVLLASVLVVSQRTARSAVAVSIVDGLGLYLVGTLVLYAAGIQSPAGAARTGGLGSSIGLLANRLLLPLAPNLDTAAMFASAYIVALAALWYVGNRLTTTRLIGGLAACFVLVAADTRTEIALTAIFVVAVIVSPRWLLRVAPAIVVVSLLLPVYYGSIQNDVGPLLNSVGGVFASRQGEASNSSLNGRATIWAATTNVYDGSSSYRRAIGWGNEGQIPSGASAEYAHVFVGFTSDTSEISAHSSLLQQLLDAGLVGVILLVGGLVWAVGRLAPQFRRGDPTALVAAAVILPMVVAGAQSAALAPTTDGLPFLVILALVTGCASAPSPEVSGTNLASEARDREVAYIRRKPSPQLRRPPSAAGAFPGPE